MSSDPTANGPLPAAPSSPTSPASGARPAIRPEIFNVVRDAIAESLMVEPGEIKLESGLIDDLGADSLDFVDIVFMLDRELDIKVRESEFNFLTRLDFSSPQVMRDGFLTSDVIDRLRDWLPALAAVPDASRVTPRQLFSLLTVESICIVAQRRVDARGG